MATASGKQVVVITGCSSGIGLHTAVLLAMDGRYKVFATMRNLDKKKPLKKAAGSSIKKTLFIRELDISKEASITSFVRDTLENEGKIDVLINNAAFGQFGAFESVPMEQMQALFQTNFFGTARITQEVVKSMKRRKSGRIIFISSSNAFLPFPFMDFYVASKFAIEGLLASTAPYLHQYNIRVSSIQPGRILTEFSKNVEANNQGGAVAMDRQSPETNALTEILMRNWASTLKREIQEVEEVAAVIKSCIECENPDLRIQTGPLVPERARTYYVDPTGNEVNQKLIDMMIE